MLIVMGWLAGGSHAWQGMARSDGFPAPPGWQQRCCGGRFGSHGSPLPERGKSTSVCVLAF